MKSKIVIHKLSDWQKVVDSLLPHLRPGQLLLISGSLGAGKTTFIKILAERLFKKETLSSPSFTIAVYYKSGNQSLLHVDCYRIKGEDPEIAAYLKEEIELKKSIIAVEWPERLKINWPKSAIKIQIERLKNETRLVSIN